LELATVLSWGWGEEEEGGDSEGEELVEKKESRSRLRSTARCRWQLILYGLQSQAQQKLLLSLDELREGALHKICASPWQS